MELEIQKSAFKASAPLRWLTSIICLDKSARPDLLGHGFFLGVNGHHLLISAAHVFDHLNDGPPLLIPGLQNFVPLNGLSKYLPPPPPKGRNFDPIDLGFVVVDPIIRELPYDSDFAAPSDLIASASHLPEYAYVVCGFAPNSVKRVFGKPILKGAPLFYTSACLPASFHNKRHTSPKTNLAIHFNKKKAFDRHNYLVQPPDPRGLSGSPILAMANAENSYGVTPTGDTMAVTKRPCLET